INEYMKLIADEVSAYNMKCDVIVCGYEQSGSPFILRVSHPGIVTNSTGTGFDAVGIGWNDAIGKLITDEHERKDSLPNVMYDAVDAKISAEIGPFVGYGTDVTIIVFSEGSAKTHIVPTEINDILDRLWMMVNKTPFQKPYNNPPPQK